MVKLTEEERGKHDGKPKLGGFHTSSHSFLIAKSKAPK